MRRALIAVLLTGLLGGCTETTISFSNGQFNQASEPFPSNYRSSASTVLARLPVAPGQKLSVSYPRLTTGVTANDPKRWYVCVQGIAPASGTPDVQPIVVFDRFGAPMLIRLTVEDVCRDATGYQSVLPA